MDYKKLLKDPQWQKKRLEILERDNWFCQQCGDAKTTLHIHHLKYEKGKNPWEYNENDLITLCEDCHKLIENHKNKYDNFEYNKYRIYKSNNWVNGSKIMFCSFNDFLTMEIYDENGEYIIGFDLNDEIHEIIRFLKIKPYYFNV